jgi:hypothetical protein
MDLTKGCASRSGSLREQARKTNKKAGKATSRRGCNLIASDNPAEVATAECAILIIEPKNPPELVKSTTANRTALVTFRAPAGECPTAGRLPQ